MCLRAGNQRMSLMTKSSYMLNEDGEILDELCVCGCLLSVHYIGIDGLDIRNCPNALSCGCSRPADRWTIWTPLRQPANIIDDED